MDEQSKKDLESHRTKLRDIDEKIIDLVAARMRIVKNIGDLKQHHSLPILDEKQESKNLAANRAYAGTRLSPELCDDLTAFLTRWARKLQEKSK